MGDDSQLEVNDESEHVDLETTEETPVERSNIFSGESYGKKSGDEGSSLVLEEDDFDHFARGAFSADPELVTDSDEEAEIDEEIEIDENQFAEADEAIGSVSDNSVIDSYLEEIQTRLKGNKVPKEYLNKTFWVERSCPSFLLAKKVDPSRLYLPRVFLWLPHHLKNDLNCPKCKAQLKIKGFNTSPRARKVVDIDRYNLEVIYYSIKKSI